MTRKRKSRKIGSEGPAVYREKSTTQLELEARKRQKDKKRKGLKSGSRHSAAIDEQKKGSGKARDPRLGSKKPIPLVVDNKPKTKKERRMSAEQELAMLENDAQLMVLLDRLEAGESLGAGLQKQVDEKLDRIEQLMKQLGLLEEEQPEFDEQPVAKGPQSDDELLAQFENMDYDDFDKE